jgi:hypothetical protein
VRARDAGNEDPSEIVWEGADDSKILVIKLYPETAYMEFHMYRDADEDASLKYEEKKKSLASGSSGAGKLSACPMKATLISQ